MSFNDAGAPSLPSEFTPYNSYADGPIFQNRFTYVWVSILAVSVALTGSRYLFNLVRYGRWRRVQDSLCGVTEDWNDSHGDWRPTPPSRATPMSALDAVLRRVSTIGKAFVAIPMLGFKVPYIQLNLGQILLIAGYLATTLICIIYQAPLVDNPNRAGFIALAQLPPLFLFSSKNSILPMLFGPSFSYTKLNWVHRYLGRGFFIATAIHGSLWIQDHLRYGTPIIGSQKETSGVATFGVLCVIVIMSFRPIREWSWGLFRVVHVIGYVSFFISMCYHTIYTVPWIFPPLAFYAFDLFCKMIRFRAKDATLDPVDNQMTIIRIRNSTSGWTAGQHIRLRVLFSSGRFWESHSLSIASAPSHTTCLSEGGILLGARVRGDWTKSLNVYASDELRAAAKAEKSGFEDESRPLLNDGRVPAQVFIDGPYGGPTIDPGSYSTIVLFAGGSGVTFTLGVLDDIVGRCVKLGRSGGEKTTRIEFGWCVRGFGSIEWFARQLQEIATVAQSASSTLDLHISIYVTCLCNPEAVPPIPNCDVLVERPKIRDVIDSMMSGKPRSSPPSLEEWEEKKAEVNAGCSGHASADSQHDVESGMEESPKLPKLESSAFSQRSLGVLVAGPPSLIRESGTAVESVRRAGLLNPGRMWDVGFCGEVYSV